MGNLVETLAPHRCVGFDSAVFIYHIEQQSRRSLIAGSALRALADGQFTGVTSILTLLEVTVQPLRLNRPEVADAYELLIQQIENLDVVEIDARGQDGR